MVPPMEISGPLEGQLGPVGRTMSARTSWRSLALSAAALATLCVFGLALWSLAAPKVSVPAPFHGGAVLASAALDGPTPDTAAFVLAAMKKEAFDEGRLAVLRGAADTNAWNTSEIASFLGRLTWESNYLGALRMLTDKGRCTNTSAVVDPTNADPILKKVPRSDVDEAKKLLAQAIPGQKVSILSDEAIAELLRLMNKSVRSAADFQKLLGAVQQRSMASDKIEVVKSEIRERPLQFSGEQLHQLLGKFTFSSDRASVAGLLEKFVSGLTCEDVKSIVADQSLAFSADKLAALRALKANIVDPQNKQRIISVFTFESDKTEASKVLQDVCARKSPPNNPVFGVVKGNPVVIIVDKSGSMSTTFQAGGQTFSRDDFCYRELTSVLRSLPITTYFDVIRFSSSASSSFPEPVLATPENVAAAIKWIKGNVGGSTNTLAALAAAYSMKISPQQIYVLSDGAPDQTPASILAAVDNMDKSRNIPVNTIAFLLPSADASMRSFMEGLAKKTAGSFRALEGSAPAVAMATSPEFA